MYEKLNESGLDITSLSLPESLWKSLWRLNISERIKLFLWKCLQDVLPTNAKLYGKVKDVSPLCTMCKNEIETTEHLLFHCNNAASIWNSAPNPAISLDLSRKLRNNFKWKAPSLGNLKFNVDATWISESLPSTYAFILRNELGKCEGGKAGLAAGLDPSEAEAIGVWQKAVWANEKQIKNFSIEGDCESLFNYINGQNADVSWRAKAYMQESHRLAHLCNNFLGFVFVPRLGNQVDDTIAKFAKNVSNNFEWEKIPPICSRKQLLVDKFNIGSSTNLILDGSTSFVTLTLPES
ncbi:uncharacterized protein LOC113335458 [Papaver somniferum]|uniref:uncharacterized protein LOC113335458 n=1 Tax=Papaver somniferum TaxID=3469 RepID=UPI000E70083A|nr:uncharacterized protein LOC113335458 [Papaver somniferum]